MLLRRRGRYISFDKKVLYDGRTEWKKKRRGKKECRSSILHPVCMGLILTSSSVGNDVLVNSALAYGALVSSLY